MAAVRSGSTCRVVAERFGVAASSVVKWSQLEARTGAVVPGRTGGHRKPVLAPHHDWLMARVQECSEVTLFALRDELLAKGVQVSHDTVWRYLRGAGLSFKKSVLASEQDRADVARRRERWQRYQGLINPQRLVFIDETWTKTNMSPLRGWGRRGDRVKAKAPFGHWNTMAFLAALRHDRIEAPWVFDGPINAEIFHTYVEKVLVPTLHPGDLVILDNLGSHKAPAIRAAIRAAGARLWLAPLGWFLPGPVCMRGAQRGISLATGTFTGESTWNPLAV